jgi:transposase-like protein
MAEKQCKRNHYPDDYKREMVKKAIASGLPTTVFASSVGLDHTVLHRWCKKYKDEFPPAIADSESRDLSSTEMTGVKEEIASIKRTMGLLQNVVRKVLSDKYTKDLIENELD